MSIPVMNAVWYARADKGTPLAASSDRFVLLCIADDADEDGYCWPAHKRIVRKTGLSLATVKRSIRGHESTGLLQRAERLRGNGSSTSNAYRINVAMLADLAVESTAGEGDNPLAELFR